MALLQDSTDEYFHHPKVLLWTSLTKGKGGPLSRKVSLVGTEQGREGWGVALEGYTGDIQYVQHFQEHVS